MKTYERYVVVERTDFLYDLPPMHKVLQTEDGHALPVYSSYAEAAGWMRTVETSRPLYDNACARSTAVFGVVQDIDPSEWNSWPDDLADAAKAIASEEDDDCDWGVLEYPRAAALAVDGCVVNDPDDPDNYLFCREVVAPK